MGPKKAGRRKLAAAMLTLSATALFTFAPIAHADLVTNGSFELNASSNPVQIGQVNVFTTLLGWTVGAPLNSAQSNAFAFVLDANADSTGFPSENSPPNIKVWGPGSGVGNGFTGSGIGSYFLGVDADYARGVVSQTINGLTVGVQYDLSFAWAGSQFTDQTGATTQWWQVSLGGDSVDTPHTAVPSQGFTGWMNFNTTFTATASSEVLSFLASATPFSNGGPAGLPPFVLLDGVSLTEHIDGSGAPEPGTSALLLGGFLAGLGVLRVKHRAKR